MTHSLALGRFFGSLRGRMDVAGLVLTETRYRPHAEIAIHAHAHGFACFVVDGGFSAQVVGRARQDAAAGGLSYHPAGEEHGNRFGDRGGTTFNIEFGREWGERLAETTRAAHPARFPATTTAPRLAAEAYRQFRRRDAMASLAIEGLSLGLLAELGRLNLPPATRRPAWWPKVVEYLHAHFAGPISLSAVARVAGVHPVHLARTFRLREGCSLGAYIRRLRLQYASDLMRSDRSLAAIAALAGFADQSHLTATFRRALGVTPAEFRRRLPPLR